MKINGVYDCTVMFWRDNTHIENLQVLVFSDTEKYAKERAKRWVSDLWGEVKIIGVVAVEAHAIE